MSPVPRDRGVLVGMMGLEDGTPALTFLYCVPSGAQRCSPAWKSTVWMR